MSPKQAPKSPACAWSKAPAETERIAVRSLWRDKYALAGNRYAAALELAEQEQGGGGGDRHREVWCREHERRTAWERLTRQGRFKRNGYATKRLGRSKAWLLTTEQVAARAEFLHHSQRRWRPGARFMEALALGACQRLPKANQRYVCKGGAKW